MSRILTFIVLISFAISCKKSGIPDVSKISADIEFVRTERELASVKKREEWTLLIQQNPAFFQIYNNEILPVLKSNNQDSSFISLNEFLADTMVHDLFLKVEKEYGDIEDVKQATAQMYKYFKYYFPKYTSIPRIYTFISEFGYQIFIFEDQGGKDGIGLGLDMFLNPQVDYKMVDPDNTNFSDYITRTWNRHHIPRKIADLHISDLLGEAPGHRLIDHMIHNGKALYIADMVLPEVHDTIITEYSDRQLKWCLENELQMWSFFFDQKLFFETSPGKIGKYIHPSPGSPDMPAEAPGRTANFIGWQIVKAYMDRYPETTLQQLLDMKDSQMMMEKSKYKPRQK